MSGIRIGTAEMQKGGKMTNKEAIRLIRNLPTMCEFTDAYGEPIDSDAYYKAVDMAISALQAQDVPDTNVGDLISRQAAIDALAKAFSFHSYGGGIAIKTILNVPYAQPEPCEDAVSRPTLLQMYQQVCKGIKCADCKFHVDDVSDCKLEKFIHQLPSVTPKAQLSGEGTTFSEPKTGKWILHDNQRQEDIDNGNYLYICSECNKSDLHAKSQEVPYCWWCGAKMEGHNAL